MARTVFDYMQAVQMVINAIPKETERIVNANKTKIISLNQEQIEAGKDVNDNVLKNSNPIFTGRYSIFTQEKARQSPIPLAPKIAGQLYNFIWNGDFASNYEIVVKYPVFEIINTGTGSGDKKDFFDGYNGKLLGLSAKDQKKVNYEIIQPELNAYIKKYL